MSQNISLSCYEDWHHHGTICGRQLHLCANLLLSHPKCLPCPLALVLPLSCNAINMFSKSSSSKYVFYTSILVIPRKRQKNNNRSQTVQHNFTCILSLEFMNLKCIWVFIGYFKCGATATVAREHLLCRPCTCLTSSGGSRATDVYPCWCQEPSRSVLWEQSLVFLFKGIYFHQNS